MAVLPDSDRIAVWAEIMRDLSLRHDPVSIVKSDLRAAVNALDDFMNTNATAINNALPAPAKAGLTTQQKALILMYVISKRYEVG